MNTSKSNFIKTKSTKQRFANDIKTDRRESHKALNQSRRIARNNKQSLHATAYAVNKEVY